MSHAKEPSDPTAAARAKLLEAFGELVGLSEGGTVLVTAEGAGVSLRLSSGGPTEGPDHAGDRTPGGPPRAPSAPVGCAGEILALLRGAGRRMTAAEIMTAMTRKGADWGESKTKITLAALVDLGLLVNDQTGNPRGYGLP